MNGQQRGAREDYYNVFMDVPFDRARDAYVLWILCRQVSIDSGLAASHGGDI
jgi:hypothetical protein